MFTYLLTGNTGVDQGIPKKESAQKADREEENLPAVPVEDRTRDLPITNPVLYYR